MISENKIIWLQKTDSTNKFVKTLIINNAIKNGTIIAAKEQTNGKGQQNNIWLTQPKLNLTFSLYIEIKIKAIYQFYISKIIALSIYEFASKEAENTTIKWPNDIYIGNSKVAGILIENTIQGENITKSIIGVGININQSTFDKSLPNPISLKNITGKTYDLNNSLIEISNIINKNLKVLNNFRITDNLYNNLLYKLNTKSKFKDIYNSNIFEGEIIGTEQDGRIKIKTQNLIKRFGFHEIKYIL